MKFRFVMNEKDLFVHVRWESAFSKKSFLLSVRYMLNVLWCVPICLDLMHVSGRSLIPFAGRSSRARPHKEDTSISQVPLLCSYALITASWILRAMLRMSRYS